jgi:hypothetical protein
VDDNFHYMDESKRYEHGVFATWDEAVAACKRIVDDDLARTYKPGMSSEELFGSYVRLAKTLSSSASQPAGRSRLGTMRESGALSWQGRASKVTLRVLPSAMRERRWRHGRKGERWLGDPPLWRSGCACPQQNLTPAPAYMPRHWR